MRPCSSVVLFGLVGLALALSALPEPARAAPDNPPRAGSGGLVGATAPPFRTTRVSGPDPATLVDLRGRVVILDFWATWCGPCRTVMPLLDDLHRRYHGRGLSVIGISGEPRGVVERHLSSNPVRYTMALDVQGTGRSYGVHAIPTLVVIDRRGKVRRVYAGLNGERLRELDALVPELLRE